MNYSSRCVVNECRCVEKKKKGEKKKEEIKSIFENSLTASFLTIQASSIFVKT